MVLRRVDISNFEPIGTVITTRPDIGFVAIESLIIDGRYQRDIERRGRGNIHKIATNFDWAKFSPILVSKRPRGVYAIIDGQHRAHAAALCGIQSVPAMISELTLEQEASAFSWVNGTVTALTPNQKFKAALAAFEPWAVQCQAVVLKAGCRLMPYNKSSDQKMPGEIYCIGLVRRFVEAGASAALIAALQGVCGSGVKDDRQYYNASKLGSLVTAAVAVGITRADIITSFLDNHDLEEVAGMVTSVRMKPGFSGKSFKSLFSDSVTVLMKKYATEARS